MFFIYFITAICATTLGSLAGLGGGVIIKPILDALGDYNLSTVEVLSSITVFSMAFIATIKQFKSGFKINLSIATLAIGSILGGGIGKKAFDIFLTLFDNESYGKGIQAIILTILLVLVLLKNSLPKYKIINISVVFLVGLLLGGIASFLGIGGGPINVAILVTLFAFSTKNAAISSIFIILLSQFSKLFLIYIDSGFSNYNLQMLPVMVIGGTLGGFIGAKLNHYLSNEYIEKIFNISIVCIILINMFNIYKAFN